ncbi:MAG: GIY-YIG nuclease family protein [Oscillospiraceae bacterium]|nr:GIY-YIG nuclease family protein [Oscillospiraceae bacterium]
MKSYIYIMANTLNTVLYIGVTSDLKTRVAEHKASVHKYSFTSKYKCTKLVYLEVFSDINEAIKREKQLKKWKREWKNTLIEKFNPEWEDLLK